jgi:hypothetical protein
MRHVVPTFLTTYSAGVLLLALLWVLAGDALAGLTDEVMTAKTRTMLLAAFGGVGVLLMQRGMVAAWRAQTVAARGARRPTTREPSPRSARRRGSPIARALEGRLVAGPSTPPTPPAATT